MSSKLNFYHLSVLCSLLMVCGLNGDIVCKTPKGEEGVCQHISDCTVLKEVLFNEHRSEEDTQFLYKSTIPCPQENNVCCPTCYTIEGRIGTCAEYDKNLHFLSENWDKLRKSSCYNSQLFCTELPSVQTRSRLEIKKQSCEHTVSWYPPDDDSGCCGNEADSISRIAGGTNTSLEQHPWLAIIEYKYNRLELCGGALISNRYVLTAAHCVNSRKRPVSVVLGEYDTSKHPDCILVEGKKDCNSPVRIAIAGTTVHPEYDEKDFNLRNDIALITLKRAAPYTDFIRPICLPTGHEDITEAPPRNFQLIAAGWGATDEAGTPSNIKLKVNLRFVNLQECFTAYRNMELPVELWTYQMCAGGNHRDSCQGDSGSPLMYAVGSKHQVLGIVSSGIGKCGEYDIPGIYTKVWNYEAWIRNNMKPWN